MATVTQPMALDSTLQATNTALGGIAKDNTLQSTNSKMDSVVTKLQGIIDALGVDTSVYKAAGNKTCAELLPALLVASNLGNVYNITDSGTTTSDFVEGSGKPIHIGDNVAVVDIGTGGSHVYKFDLLAGMVDLSNYIQKSSTAGLVKNDGTIDTNSYATTSAVSAKADKVTGATNNDLAGLDANGNLIDSGIAKSDIEDIQDVITTDTTSASGNPLSIVGLKSTQNAINPIVTLEPIQDLHGQDKPYPAGGGKNKLPLTVDGIKAENTDGSWSGNVYTLNNVTFTILVDNDNNVIGIKANATTSASADADFYIKNNFSIESKAYCLGGCPSGGSSYTYRISISGVGSDIGVGLPISSSVSIQGANVYIRIGSGYTPNNIIFYPQLEEGGTKTAFAPYTNECSISGYDEIEVLSVGVNLLDKTKAVANERYNDKGTVSYSGSSRSVPIRIKPSTTYYFKNVYGSSTMQPIWWLDAEQKYISNTNVGGVSPASGTAASPANAYYVGVNFPSTNIDTVLVSEGQAIDYVPYVKTTDLSESLGQTSFGGELDVRQGDYTDGYFEVDLGALNWAYRTEASVSGKNVFSSTNMTAYKNGNDVNAICSGYNYAGLIGGLADMANKNDFDICVLASNGSNYIIYLRDSRYTNASQLKTALSGVKLVIERQSANHIQLTPHEISLLKDYAYVSTNGTRIDLDYRNGEMATLGDVLDAQNKLQEEIDNPISYDGKNYRLGMDATGLYLYNITDDTKAYIQMVTT